MDDDFDVEAYILGMHEAMSDMIGDDPAVRLALMEMEAFYVVNGMMIEYGIDGVRIATKRLRHTIDTAERNALMANLPMQRSELNG